LGIIREFEKKENDSSRIRRGSQGMGFIKELRNPAQSYKNF
jgi:hypothetical protein